VPFNTQQKNYQKRIAQYLQSILLDNTHSPLNEALRYSLLGNGKRLRPLLVYATGESLGANLEALDPPAAAIELIHTYSLIHDDLPAMDNDDFRRGQPTCHKKFNEATAILAGDMLQSLSFKLLAQSHPHLSADQQIRMVDILSIAAMKMVDGQVLDLREQTEWTTDELDHINKLKTGALIEASVLLGFTAANSHDETIHLHLQSFAQHLGLAFQIQDDLLDLQQDGVLTEENNNTYPGILGLEKTKQAMSQHYEAALQDLQKCGFQHQMLTQITEMLITRKY